MVFYIITIFISAFLLFQIEPMIGKYILPWFGGTPAVWSTLMLFFQVVLLGGYAYSHWLVDRFNPRKQGLIHLCLLSFSIAVMVLAASSWASPITPGINWKPQGNMSPVFQVFIVLGISVGLPYFILSTNSPIQQVWFNHAFPHRSPYPLYALSNVGSLLALVTYPVLIEPLLTLKNQGELWSIGYLIFTFLCAFQAIRLIKKPTIIVGELNQNNDQDGSLIEDKPSKLIQWTWIAFAACASIMLLAVTNQISQEVAVIPFLWVLPLTIYLLSFILCFSSERWYSRKWYLFFLFLASGLYIWVLTQGVDLNILVQIGTYSFLLFIICMICHGEVYRLRPKPRELTRFYLMVSIGGAIGGVFVNFIAPVIFTGFWELPLGVVLCWILLIGARFGSVSKDRSKKIAYLSNAVLLSFVFLLGVILLAYIQVISANSLSASRNFYGVLRVKEADSGNLELEAYQLTHGATVHGFQYAAADKRRLPTVYYTEESGVGIALLNSPKRNTGMRVGILGLGIGTLAAYAQPGDTYRFYEINPEVIRLAQGNGGFFSYLSDSPAKIEIVPGDARISLEHEMATNQLQNYDILVLDTFNSDSIPVHLLTKEAFGIYLKHLQPDGLLALHISNKHLDLGPVVAKLADYYKLDGSLIITKAKGERQYTSAWVLLTHNRDLLNHPAFASRSTSLPAASDSFRLWTDDYSNLFQILR